MLRNFTKIPPLGMHKTPGENVVGPTWFPGLEELLNPKRTHVSDFH